jgi:hypothetical protein
MTLNPVRKRDNQLAVLRAIVTEVNRIAGLVGGEGSSPRLVLTGTEDDNAAVELHDRGDILRCLLDSGTGTASLFGTADQNSNYASLWSSPSDGTTCNAGMHLGAARPEVNVQVLESGDETTYANVACAWHSADLTEVNNVVIQADDTGAQVLVHASDSSSPPAASIDLVTTPTSADLSITGGGVILKSPDGTGYRIKVADDGTLGTETVTG